MAKIELNVGDLKAKRNVKGLIKALKCEDRNIRRYAAEALGLIGNSRAVEPLTEAVKDKSDSVRTSAADALEQIIGKREIEPKING